jgi:RHS repeat-associated protein
MTDAAKATVWQAVFKPFGEVQAITGAASLDARFPGQWFQIESGLAYNWHRHYDATTGRYTQADPLGFVDGPSVYGYAGQSPLENSDKDGRRFGPNTGVPQEITDKCVSSCLGEAGLLSSAAAVSTVAATPIPKSILPGNQWNRRWPGQSHYTNAVSSLRYVLPGSSMWGTLGRANICAAPALVLAATLDSLGCIRQYQDRAVGKQR